MTTVQKQPPITPAGRERLRQELDRLLQQRQEMSARLREEMQQKEEDFNLYQTHEELAQLQARIVQLQSVLDAPEGEDEAVVPDGVIGVGSDVTVQDEAGKKQSFTIVTPIEADASRGFISYTSPVGSALLGGRPGDEVTVPVPKGERKLTIVEVS